MSYIPSYLDYNHRQHDGWPKGVSDSTKVWAVKQIENLFKRHRHVWLDLANDTIFMAVDCPAELANASLNDFRYAVAERALRAANAEHVWIEPYDHVKRRFWVNFHNDDRKSLFLTFEELALKYNSRLKEWASYARLGDIYQNEEVIVVCSHVNSSKPT